MNEAKLHLLIVDDDADLLEPVIEICKRFDFQVTGVSSALEALKLIQQGGVDVVLTDVRMQPMGGFALVESARRVQPLLPFILWTGFWDRPDEQRAAKIANLETLEKPFSFSDLEAVLGRVRARAGSAPAHTEVIHS